MAGKSIKTKAYKKNKFEKTRDYLLTQLQVSWILALTSDEYFVSDCGYNL